MSTTTNNCAQSATTIGAANASGTGTTSKHQAWNSSLHDIPYKFYVPMNQEESLTQPERYSKASLTGFPQVTAHASGNTAINLSLRPQPLELLA